MKLNQPYYIEPRKNAKHVDLDGKWDYFWLDESTNEILEDMWKYSATLPKSLYHCVYEAGLLPDPYVGENIIKYTWIHNKTWYFRKKFSLTEKSCFSNAYLCFDGVSYYSRLWVNGQLMGDHEGMFGGPVCDVADYINIDKENEIILEVTACVTEDNQAYDSRNEDGFHTYIVPWAAAGDIHTTPDFWVVGIWNRVRLELIDRFHVSRPYIYTKSIEGDEAELRLEMEVIDGHMEELRQYIGYDDNVKNAGGIPHSFCGGLVDKTVNMGLSLKVSICDREGNLVYLNEEDFELPDFYNLGFNPKYIEQAFYYKTITIKNPKLWYPVGMGDAYLYDVKIELMENGKLCDEQTLKTGIRTFTADRTAGRKYRMRWNNFLFSVNGEKIFLKGMNWMPIDYLYNIDPKEYEWCLTLAKNAGIQLFRVWGGGMPETDTFYELCDKLGIMVWQDHRMSNTSDTHCFPQDILEYQEAYNLYRTRNHPSLVLHCGGNEGIPYSRGNAATMFVIQRIIEDLDPVRIFHRSSPDMGSAHIYCNMEPVWFRYQFSALPFVGEAGIHCFPSFNTLKQFLRESELSDIIPDMSSQEFRENFTDLLAHFVEFDHNRVTHFLARASQIISLENIRLKELCEASHVQSHELNTIMIQSMRGNYPVCGGIMPWVYKRPWPNIGVQHVDGLGQPLYPYYAIQNTYKPTNISLVIDWVLIAPMEKVPLVAKVLCENQKKKSGQEIVVDVYNPDMSSFMRYSTVTDGRDGCYELGEFIPDDSYTDKCFLINITLKEGNKIISRTTYTIKCTSILSDEAFFKDYRSSKKPNLYFKNGPFLKSDIEAASKANLSVSIIEQGILESYHYKDVFMKNNSDVPAYPVTLEVDGKKVRFFSDDNFFLLDKGEEKRVRIVYENGDGDSDIIVRWWNSDKQIVISK